MFMKANSRTGIGQVKENVCTVIMMYMMVNGKRASFVGEED